jgi:glucokinase
MNLHSRHALVADIGGTFMSFAIADIDELTVDHFALLSSADFDSPMDAVERYLKSLSQRPDKASFAVAGKVEDDSATMTFRPWTITAEAIKAVTGAKTVTLVNDVEALALSLPHLTGDELIPITGQLIHEAAPKAVVSAGTGLGIAGLMKAHGIWFPFCGEGGQVAFPATRAGEFDLRKALRQDAHLTAESVFSGAGLVALYVALARQEGTVAPRRTAPQITAAGLSGDDPIAAEAVRLMGTWFARFAGDVALLYGAQGGMYLAGGLSANIIPAMDRGAFLEAFADKGKHRSYLEAIPVNVIKTGADAGLRGAAVALARRLERAAILSKPLRRAG